MHRGQGTVSLRTRDAVLDWDRRWRIARPNPDIIHGHISDDMKQVRKGGKVRLYPGILKMTDLYCRSEKKQVVDVLYLRSTVGVFIVLILPFSIGLCQDIQPMRFDPDPETQTKLWQDLMVHESGWFASKEALRIAENILAYQRASGGWPKNIDMTLPLSTAKKMELLENLNEPLSTIDNGATYTQMHFLAKVLHVSQDPRFVLSFLKGLDYLLDAQYANGGWPQYYPLRSGYYSHITFNDEVMIGVMRLLRDVGEDTILYGFVDEERRLRAEDAVARGIDCILKTQIRVGDRLTVWCAQYDAKTLKPAKARNYELPSLSGKETVGIVQFLMGIQRPAEDIVRAVQSAVAWLDRVKIEGIRVERRPDPSGKRGFDKVVVPDPAAPPMWARFYLIGSDTPFFSDRDGKVYYRLSDISYERRNAYGWLGTWPQELLDRMYVGWQKLWAPDENVLLHPDEYREFQ